MTVSSVVDAGTVEVVVAVIPGAVLVAVEVTVLAGTVVVQGAAGTVIVIVPVGPAMVEVFVTSWMPMKVEQNDDARSAIRMASHKPTWSLGCGCK